MSDPAIMDYVWAAYAAAGIILGGVTLSSTLKFMRLKKQEKNFFNAKSAKNAKEI